MHAWLDAKDFNRRAILLQWCRCFQSADRVSSQRAQDHLCHSHMQSADRVCVCVYYCSTYYKAIRVWGGGTMEDMCYERLRAEACVD